MNCIKFIYIIFAVLIIQAQISVGRFIMPAELKSLVAGALEINDCARVVKVSQPIPLRFRRANNGKTYQCIITLK